MKYVKCIVNVALSVAKTVTCNSRIIANSGLHQICLHLLN